MKEEGKQYCDVSKVYIAPIAKNIAKDIIVQRHYTHAWTSCRYSLGIYYKSEDANTFDGDKLIGCIIYGFPVGAKAATSVCEGLTKDNILELTRLYCDDGYGSNIESYAISQSFKWIKENDKAIKLLLSYADAGQQHLGAIYQATNWIYQGISSDIALMPNWGISLHENPYKWIHSRTVFSKWGSGNLLHLKNEIGKEGYTHFWRRMEPPKHRYVQLLPQDKRERKSMMAALKHPIRPYPKNATNYNTEVVMHETIYVAPVGDENYW